VRQEFLQLYLRHNVTAYQPPAATNHYEVARLALASTTTRIPTITNEWLVASGKGEVVRGMLFMVLRVKEKNEEAQLSIDLLTGQTINLYVKEREGKLHADSQSQSTKLSTSAEPSSQWGQARLEGVGKVCGGRCCWLGHPATGHRLKSTGIED
jgi:hypothetical protein